MQDGANKTPTSNSSLPTAGMQHDASAEQELYASFLICQYLADQKEFVVVRLILHLVPTSQYAYVLSCGMTWRQSSSLC